MAPMFTGQLAMPIELGSAELMSKGGKFSSTSGP